MTISVVSVNVMTTIIINNRRLVTLAEHPPDHGKQTNSNTNEWREET